MISEGMGVLLGAIIGSLGGPLIQDLARSWRTDRPRKKLLKQLLNDGKFRFKGLEYLSRTIGADEADTRRLLIEVGARGAVLKKSGKEGWALITRAPLKESLRKIEEQDDLDESK